MRHAALRACRRRLCRRWAACGAGTPCRWGQGARCTCVGETQARTRPCLPLPALVPAGGGAAAARPRRPRAPRRLLPPLQPAVVGAHAARHAARDCAGAAAGAVAWRTWRIPFSYCCLVAGLCRLADLLPMHLCLPAAQGLVLDVKGILGADTDVPALLAQMITPPEPAALQQGASRLRVGQGFSCCCGDTLPACGSCLCCTHTLHGLAPCCTPHTASLPCTPQP